MARAGLTRKKSTDDRVPLRDSERLMLQDDPESNPDYAQNLAGGDDHLLIPNNRQPFRSTTEREATFKADVESNR